MQIEADIEENLSFEPGLSTIDNRIMSYSLSTTERNCVWCVVDALCETGGHISMHYLITGTLFVRRLLTTADGGRDTVDTMDNGQ